MYFKYQSKSSQFAQNGQIQCVKYQHSKRRKRFFFNVMIVKIKFFVLRPHVKLIRT